MIYWFIYLLTILFCSTVKDRVFLRAFLRAFLNFGCAAGLLVFRATPSTIQLTSVLRWFPAQKKSDYYSVCEDCHTRIISQITLITLVTLITRNLSHMRCWSTDGRAFSSKDYRILWYLGSLVIATVKAMRALRVPFELWELLEFRLNYESSQGSVRIMRALRINGIIKMPCWATWQVHYQLWQCSLSKLQARLSSIQSSLTDHSFIHAQIHSLIDSFTHSFTHSLTHTYIHSFIHSFTALKQKTLKSCWIYWENYGYKVTLY